MSQSNAHDHGHDHDHDHTPTVTSANERKVLVSFFLIFGFMLVEAVGGVLSGSLALLADAGHMLTDAVALALAYAALRLLSPASRSTRVCMDRSIILMSDMGTSCCLASGSLQK